MFKNQSHVRSTVEKMSKSKKSSFSAIIMKNSPIFSKFSQEMYYMMLKQNPVTVCHKSGPVHIKKSKRWPPVRLSKNEQVQKIINQSDGQVQKIVQSTSNFHRNCIIWCLNKFQWQFVITYGPVIIQRFQESDSISLGSRHLYCFNCIELNHQIALHGNIIARFELFTEHSKYLKKFVLV